MNDQSKSSSLREWFMRADRNAIESFRRVLTIKDNPPTFGFDTGEFAREMAYLIEALQHRHAAKWAAEREAIREVPCGHSFITERMDDITVSHDERAIFLVSEGASASVTISSNSIAFIMRGEIVLSFQSSGDIYVKGVLVDKDPRVVDAFREWLDETLHATAEMHIKKHRETCDDECRRIVAFIRSGRALPHQLIELIEAGVHRDCY